jgi:hypothetical protein
MTCNLNIGQGTPSGSSYYYQFSFPAKGKMHEILGDFFREAPGFAQVWRLTSTGWVSATADYLDQVNPADVYGVYLSTPNGWTAQYDCQAPPLGTGAILGIAAVGILILGIVMSGKK